ncbi:MAG: hypothetical protein AAFQ95_07130 [Cyanobacteria bacterium J06621_3]
MPWVYDPHSGGVKIPASLKEPIKQRILSYAEEHYAGKYNRIDVRFRSHFCYIDAYTEPFVSEENFDEKLYGCTREERIEFLRGVPIHLCRLRYKGDMEKWVMAFYTYSNNKYEPSMFRNGTFFGTPEEAFECSAMYLQ